MPSNINPVAAVKAKPSGVKTGKYVAKYQAAVDKAASMATYPAEGVKNTLAVVPSGVRQRMQRMLLERKAKEAAEVKANAMSDIDGNRTIPEAEQVAYPQQQPQPQPQQSAAELIEMTRRNMDQVQAQIRSTSANLQAMNERARAGMNGERPVAVLAPEVVMAEPVNPAIAEAQALRAELEAAKAAHEAQMQLKDASIESVKQVLEQESNRARQQLPYLNNKVTKVKEKYKSVLEEKAALQNQIAQQIEINSKEASTRTELQRNYETVQAKAAEQLQQIQKFDNDIKIVREELTKVKNERTELEAKKAELTKTNDKLVEDSKNYSYDKTNFEKKISELETEIAQKASEIARLSKSENDLKLAQQQKAIDLKNANESASKAIDELDTYKKRVNELDGILLTKDNAITLAETKESAALKEKNTLASRVAELQNAENEYTLERQQNALSLDQAKKSQAEALKKVEELKGRVNAAEGELLGKDNEINLATANLNRVENLLKTRDAELIAKETNIRQLNQEIAANAGEIQNLKTALSNSGATKATELYDLVEDVLQIDNPSTAEQAKELAMKRWDASENPAIKSKINRDAYGQVAEELFNAGTYVRLKRGNTAATLMRVAALLGATGTVVGGVSTLIFAATRLFGSVQGEDPDKSKKPKAIVQDMPQDLLPGEPAAKKQKKV